jgi:hypothetical protein
MDTQETVVPSGQHYSGTNRIPNIKQFMESLDKDKRTRDEKVEAQHQARLQANATDVKDHQSANKKLGKNRRTVRDPVTGRDVEIEDTDKALLKASENPTVSHSSPGRTPKALPNRFQCGPGS